MSSLDDRKIIFTCEHGGNDVPDEYKHLFKMNENVLYTHRGFDIGALEVARYLSDGLKTDLLYTTISRLLVESNRSENQPDLFSEFTSGLDRDRKNEILEKYYHPYKKKVSGAVSEAISSGQKVFHISIHSFTPVLNGKTREADIGILFDPARELETKFAKALISELKENSSRLTVMENSPYKGTDDGLTTYLRSITEDHTYAGIEIEINQKFFTDREDKVEQIKSMLLTSIRRSVLAV